MSTTFYKAFDSNLKCLDMQFEIGQEYKIEEEPICCQVGYHFCTSISDCYKYYDKSSNTRICIVEPLGKIVTDDNIKFCTNHIKIIEEVENPQEKSNTYLTKSM